MNYAEKNHLFKELTSVLMKLLLDDTPHQYNSTVIQCCHNCLCALGQEGFSKELESVAGEQIGNNAKVLLLWPCCLSRDKDKSMSLCQALLICQVLHTFTGGSTQRVGVEKLPCNHRSSSSSIFLHVWSFQSHHPHPIPDSQHQPMIWLYVVYAYAR